MTATYRYSADGVKLEAKVSSGTSNAPAGQPTAYAYLGSLVYSKVESSYQLESTSFSGGRIVPGDTQHPVHYHIADHLGSARVVAWPEEGDDAAVILEQNDYYPYGMRMNNGLTASTDSRYRFSGKEAQPLMGGSILDFGARYYNPTIARWTTIDPKAEKYYSTTPYSYCAGNPVMYVDPDGEDVSGINVKNGTIIVYMTVYTSDNAEKSANDAAEYWNQRTGDTYNGQPIQYVVSVEKNDFIVSHQKDKHNTYEFNAGEVKKHSKKSIRMDMWRLPIRMIKELFTLMNPVQGLNQTNQIFHQLVLTNVDIF